MTSAYASDNYSKYQTKNPLKAWMLKKFYRKLVTLLREEIPSLVTDSPRILDMGCGEGFTARVLLKEFPGVSYCGMDMSRQAIAYAREKISPDLFSQGDIYAIQFPDSSFDATLSLEVLEHLQRPEAALKELLRVTKSSLLVSVPNEPFFSLGNLLSLKNLRTFGNPPDHLNHWAKAGFKAFLEQNNCRIKVFTTSFPWTMALITKGASVE